MSISVEDFMKKATKEQKELLFQMSGLAEEEQKYANEINRINTSARDGFESYHDGLAVSVLEDECDIAVVSARPKQELRRVREQMKKLYEKAVKIGMGNLGIIQRHYEHYVGKPILPDS